MVSSCQRVWKLVAAATASGELLSAAVAVSGAPGAVLLQTLSNLTHCTRCKNFLNDSGGGHLLL